MTAPTTAGDGPMEVRCPSCSTQYEFDPDQLEPGGTNVRCSACGQVFKVHTQTDDEQGKWMVRRSATQEIIYFDDLATLQRWIVERKVERDDEMSDDGASWQRLGDASELDAFFHLVERADVTRAGAVKSAGAPPVARPSTAPPVRESEKPHEAAAATLVISPLAPTAPSKRPLASMPGGAPPILTREAPSETTVSSAPTGGATLALPGMPAPEPARTTRPARQATPQPTPDRSSSADEAGDTADFHDERPSRSTGPSAAEARSTAAPTEAYSLGEDARAADATLAYTLGEGGLSLDEGPSLGDEPEPEHARHEDTQAVMAAVGGGRRKRVAIGVVLILVALSATAALVTQQRSVSAPTADAEALGEEASGDGLALAALPESGDAPSEGSAEGSADSDAEAIAQTEDASEQPAVAPEVDASAPSAAEPPRQNAVAPRPARRAEPAGTPTDYDGQMSAANRALRAGRHDDALELFSAATETRPSSAEAFVGIARAYEGLGRQDLATIRYERATSINSRYTPAWLGLGDAKRRAGDIAGAVAAYERVLQVVRIGSSAERAREALEELRGSD